ncbi:phage major capsid protein, P2 family [Oceanobacter sp. 4_MG-2023]|uniref:phage major capsid protein, P2 family n=1 Tax=Oceanobacter sp. 4_MG-2023 TaxID=3062623 RepID=UPI0027344962|nr:phage major capsid protein, P2 family [Oceanobacter sp. 4_MG-2023]MDP2548890.1 phage major capsid protein, P2 family [Oceanobacter sp. 4_MG-2023]
MKTNTRAKYNKLLFAIAAANAVAVADLYNGKQFAVTEPSETTLNDKVQASSEFLQWIGMAPVTDMKGQALDLGFSDMIASRTDTSGGTERNGTELGGPTGSTWEVAKTNYDVYMRYATLDTWARYKDFYSRYMQQVFRAIALTRIKVGWYGTSVATTTNSTTNPLGQDVNKGWLQVLREQAPSRIIGEGNAAGTDKVFIGKNTDNPDYQNLDAAVYDIYRMIEVENRTGDEVVIVGSALVAADIGKTLTEHAGTPSEKKLGITTLSKSYGGLKAIEVPGFPDTGIVVTDLKNLHLYYQEGRTRRTTKDQPELDRIAEFMSSNDAYAIGDMDAIAGFEPTAVTIVDETTATATFSA